MLPFYTVFSYFSVTLEGGQLWHDLTRFHQDHYHLVPFLKNSKNRDLSFQTHPHKLHHFRQTHHQKLIFFITRFVPQNIKNLVYSIPSHYFSISNEKRTKQSHNSPGKHTRKIQYGG